MSIAPTAAWVSAILLASTLMLASCRIGPRATGHPAAHTPLGSAVTLEHRTAGRLSAELLEVRDDAILVLESQRIVSVPFSGIRRAEFGFVGVTLQDGREPTDVQRSRLRLVSRYPHGLTAERLDELLARYGQAAVTTLSP